MRDWSLITGRGGGATKREVGPVKFYAYEKRGGGKSFSHAEGGGGGANSFHSLKGGHVKFYCVLGEGGGGQNVSDPRFSNFVDHPRRD